MEVLTLESNLTVSDASSADDYSRIQEILEVF